MRSLTNLNWNLVLCKVMQCIPLKVTLALFMLVGRQCYIPVFVLLVIDYTVMP